MREGQRTTTGGLEAALRETHSKRTTRLTRRGFLKIMLKSALATGTVVALNGTASVIANNALQNKQEKLFSESDQAEKLFYESGQDMVAGEVLQVRYFARDIAKAAIRITQSGSFLFDIGAIVAGWYAGDVIGSTLDKKIERVKMRYAGALAAVAGKSIDHVSTDLFVAQMNDPRFTLYGLDAFNAEINPFYGRKPSRERLIAVGAVTTILFGLTGLVLPSLGTAYLGASGFLYKYNAKGAVQIATSLALGDEVDSKIRQGRSPEGIRDYLESVGAADIEERVELSLRQSIASYKNNNAEPLRA